MGHSPSRPNACAAGDPLPSRFARFRRRLRLHRHRSGAGDDSTTRAAILADEFAGIARIRIVKADMRFKDKFFACLSLGERTYRTDTSDKTTDNPWSGRMRRCSLVMAVHDIVLCEYAMALSLLHPIQIEV